MTLSEVPQHPRRVWLPQLRTIAGRGHCRLAARRVCAPIAAAVGVRAALKTSCGVLVCGGAAKKMHCSRTSSGAQTAPESPVGSSSQAAAQLTSLLVQRAHTAWRHEPARGRLNPPTAACEQGGAAGAVPLAGLGPLWQTARPRSGSRACPGGSWSRSTMRARARWRSSPSAWTIREQSHARALAV